MKLALIALVLLLLPALLAAQQSPRLEYPKTRAVDQVDDYFGTKVPTRTAGSRTTTAPRRRPGSRRRTRSPSPSSRRSPSARAIETRLTELWNYERYGLPSKEGPRYVFARNNGLQNQAVVYRAKRPRRPRPRC